MNKYVNIIGKPSTDQNYLFEQYDLEDYTSKKQHLLDPLTRD